MKVMVDVENKEVSWNLLLVLTALTLVMCWMKCRQKCSSENDKRNFVQPFEINLR